MGKYLCRVSNLPRGCFTVSNEAISSLAGMLSLAKNDFADFHHHAFASINYRKWWTWCVRDIRRIHAAASSFPAFVALSPISDEAIIHGCQKKKKE